MQSGGVKEADALKTSFSEKGTIVPDGSVAGWRGEAESGRTPRFLYGQLDGQ